VIHIFIRHVNSILCLSVTVNVLSCLWLFFVMTGSTVNFESLHFIDLFWFYKLMYFLRFALFRCNIYTVVTFWLIYVINCCCHFLLFVVLDCPNF